MDRIALANRLEGLSKVFVAHSPYSRDLKAMAHVLSQIDDQKFQTVLSSDFSADVEAATPPMSIGLNIPQHGRSTGAPSVARGGLNRQQKIEQAKSLFGISDQEAGEIVDQVSKKQTQTAPQITPSQVPTGAPGGMSMEASETNSEIGKYWNREASDAIRDNLLRDVLGMDKAICCDTHRHLDKDQIPDGTHAGLPERAATLKPEQTPNIAPVLDSKIVEKSHGAVKKEAGIEDLKKMKAEKAEKKSEGLEEKAKAQAEDTAETLGKAKKQEEVAEKAEGETKKSEKKEEKKAPAKEDKDATDSTDMVVEGIELTASMDDIELSAEESAKLNQLFV